MFPAGWSAREKAAKARRARQTISPEVAAARAALLAEREERIANFDKPAGDTGKLEGRIADPSEHVARSVEDRPVAPMTTMYPADGKPVKSVDGVRVEPQPKLNTHLASLPPLNEAETGDQLASQIAALTDGAPVPATVENEAAPASAEAAKNPDEHEHGEETGETEGGVESPSPTAGEGADAQTPAEEPAKEDPSKDEPAKEEPAKDEDAEHDEGHDEPETKQTRKGRGARRQA